MRLSKRSRAPETSYARSRWPAGRETLEDLLQFLELLDVWHQGRGCFSREIFSIGTREDYIRTGSFKVGLNASIKHPPGLETHISSTVGLKLSRS